MNRQLQAYTSIVAVIIVVVMSTYIILKDSTNLKHTQTSKKASHKTTALISIDKWTERKVTRSAPLRQEERSIEKHLIMDDEKKIRQEEILATKPDEFGNESSLIESELVSIGHFIPAISDELIEQERAYALSSDTVNTQIGDEIQTGIEAFNEEINDTTLGIEIGDYIPVDGVINVKKSEGTKVGEFIQVEEELL